MYIKKDKEEFTKIQRMMKGKMKNLTPIPWKLENPANEMPTCSTCLPLLELVQSEGCPRSIYTEELVP